MGRGGGGRGMEGWQANPNNIIWGSGWVDSGPEKVSS